MERNTQWLRDQNSRTIHGIIPPESVSDGSSLDLGEDFEAHSPFDGDLALQQDNGKFYYTYTSASMSSASSAAQDDASIGDSEHSGNYIHWMASQNSNKSLQHRASTSSHPSSFASSSDPLIRASLSVNGSGTSSDAYQFSQESFLPPGLCTDCSQCGILLDTMRYVCSTCGEKSPKRPESSINYRGKGKDRDDSLYPPPSHRTQPGKPLPSRPLPTLPSGHRVGSSKSSTGSGSSSSITLAGDGGFELCPSCIETAGVIHALIGASPDAANEPSSPQDPQKTLSQLRRTAPRQKGHFRHAYIEKLWGASGWKDVEQDVQAECTICNMVLVGQRYKCASCPRFILCRACYSQVHEIHPSHAFLDIPERPIEVRGETDSRQLDHLGDDGLEDECEFLSYLLYSETLLTIPSALTHPDVKCSQYVNIS